MILDNKDIVYQGQKRLREIIRKEDLFDEFISLCFNTHKYVHTNGVYSQETNGFGECVWADLSNTMFYSMPTAKDVTVAWNIWHITRIEDLTMNYLVNNTEEVLDDMWLERLNVSVRDTGNAMSDEEIIDLSMSLDMDALKAYRSAVGKRSKIILESLTFNDMKRKFPKENVDKILDSGGLTNHKDSIWLLDFWGKKDVAGILALPLTRHQLGHLNDCFKLKKKSVNKNKNYLP